jgi:hypothetical protein
MLDITILQMNWAVKEPAREGDTTSSSLPQSNDVATPGTGTTRTYVDIDGSMSPYHKMIEALDVVAGLQITGLLLEVNYPPYDIRYCRYYSNELSNC